VLEHLTAQALLHAVAVGIKNHWVHVNSERSGAELQSCRKPVGFNRVTSGRQPAHDVIDRCCVHEKIKVTMRPDLVANERAHRPSAIDLVDDGTRFKPVHDGVNLARCHALNGRFGVSHYSMVPVRHALMTSRRQPPRKRP
jgi:hypothetical protein